MPSNISHNPARILALDPGLRRIGYAVLDRNILVDYGVRTIARRRSLNDTFLEFEKAVQLLILDRNPNALAFEQTVFSQIRHNLRLTIAVQLIKQTAKSHGLPAHGYNPRTIRKVVCNDGNADRRELARTVVALYPETRLYLESNRRWRELQFQAVFDSIACALTHRSKSLTP